jgi:hypothetical protein
MIGGSWLSSTRRMAYCFGVPPRASVRVIAIHSSTPSAVTSAPRSAGDCPGTNARSDSSSTANSTSSASAARGGSEGNSRIRVRLMETDTNSRPASAAAAPASATKKLAQPSMRR